MKRLLLLNSALLVSSPPAALQELSAPAAGGVAHHPSDNAELASHRRREARPLLAVLARDGSADTQRPIVMQGPLDGV